MLLYCIRHSCTYIHTSVPHTPTESTSLFPIARLLFRSWLHHAGGGRRNRVVRGTQASGLGRHVARGAAIGQHTGQAGQRLVRQPCGKRRNGNSIGAIDVPLLVKTLGPSGQRLSNFCQSTQQSWFQPDGDKSHTSKVNPRSTSTFVHNNNNIEPIRYDTPVFKPPRRTPGYHPSLPCRNPRPLPARGIRLVWLERGISETRKASSLPRP